MARILIVEDEMNNLDVARRIVLAAGHEALVAMDGQAGLELARVERPDAILMDLLLPKMDGWAVTRAIRKEPWAAELPIIAVSALAMDADRERAREAGCNDFVTKPYAPAELRAVLNRYFADGTGPARRSRPRRRSSPPSASGRSSSWTTSPRTSSSWSGGWAATATRRSPPRMATRPSRRREATSPTSSSWTS